VIAAAMTERDSYWHSHREFDGLTIEDGDAWCELCVDGARLDGHFTAKELQRIVDALEQLAEKAKAT
jgi:tellurite resistance protein